MKKGLVISVIVFFAFLSLVSARLTVSEPLGVYNVGDKLYITVTAVPSEVSGDFVINLECSNVSINIYRVPAEPSFTSGMEQKVSTFITLTNKKLGNLTGNCRIYSSLGEESVVSKQFLISKEVLVKASLDKIAYDPGEQITLSIEAVKANGQLLNGFLDVSGATDFSKEISQGKISESFAMDKTKEAGSYNLSLYVYDILGEEVLNSGIASVSFNLNQIPSSIQVSIANPEAMPGSNFSFGAQLFDQSGKAMEGTFQAFLISPDNKQEQVTLDSGGTASYNFKSSAMPGNWKVMVAYNSLAEERDISVPEVPKVEFKFEGTVLVVKSVGNALYNNTVNVSIGGGVQELSLSLLPGEERKFNLKAPDGEYDVVVGDGNSTAQQKLLLTGNAISVKDLTGGLFTKYPIIWYLVLGIFAVGGLFFVFGKLKRKMSFGSESSLKPVKTGRVSDEKFVDVIKSSVGEGESGFVSNGQKLNSSVVVIKLSNSSGLRDLAGQEIEKVVAMAKERKGVVEFKDNYLTVVFSPLITKTLDNEPLAARFGFDVSNRLKEFNSRYNNQISFNVGINNGDLLSSVEGGRLKYTSMGNTLLLARKLADFSSSKVLVSDSFRNKMSRDIRGERIGQIGNVSAFSIVSLTDRGANQDKLADLLKRMDHL